MRLAASVDSNSVVVSVMVLVPFPRQRAAGQQLMGEKYLPPD